MRAPPAFGCLRAFCATMLLATLVGCAFDLAHVDQSPAPLRAAATPLHGFTLSQDVDLSLPYGFKRVLKRGTRWRHVGDIPQGHVFRTDDQVLTVEASNIHEAYVVLQDDELVGFYLPVEKTFSPLRDKKRLPAAASN